MNFLLSPCVRKSHRAPGSDNEMTDNVKLHAEQGSDDERTADGYNDTSTILTTTLMAVSVR
jgi:hypothetical protein